MKANDFVGYLFGMALAIPFSYPSPPYYWGSFLVIFIWLLYAITGRVQLDVKLFMIVACYFLMVLISNIFMDISSVNYIAFLGVFLVGIMFNFSWSGDSLIKGYVFMSLFLAIYIIILYVVTGSYHYGYDIFLIPSDRMWANQYMYDWPNFIAIIFAAAIFFAIFLKKYNYLWILFLALILTTSRVLYSVIIFLFLYRVVKSRRSIRNIALGLIVVAFAIAIYYYFNNVVSSGIIHEYITNRVFKFGDRTALYGSLLGQSMKSIWFGHGSADFFKETIRYSFHNSYLQVLYRNGILALFAYIILLWFLFRRMVKGVGGANILSILFLFILFSSLFNDYLGAPYVVLMVAFLSSYSKEKLRADS